MPLKKLVPVVLIAIAPLGSAAAQERSFGSCWLRPAPLPACRTILVTEASVEIPVATSSHDISAGTTEKDFDVRFMLSAGFLRNFGGNKATGVIVSHDVNRSLNRIPTRIEGRFRKWNGTSAIDVSAGATKKFIDGRDRTGLTAAVGGEAKYIGVDLRVDLHPASSGTVVGAFGGVRATSVAAPVGALAVFGAVAALIIATGAGY